MTFIKKMCILRQVKQGFSGDGKTLSGLVKIEQYGKNLSVEVSVINFAPLASGEYYCLIADEDGRTELLPLRGKSYFNIVSELDLSGGFCAVVCFVKNEIVPIAYGVNGTKTYDWRTLVKTAVPSAPAPDAAFTKTSAAFLWERTDEGGVDEVKAKKYDDETIAAANYYEEEQTNEFFERAQSAENASTQSPHSGERETAGRDLAENDDDQGVRDAFKLESDDYHLSVKAELDALFARYPEDKTLTGTYPSSKWVRVEEENKTPYLVGVIYEELKAKYICYALPTKDGANPPERLEKVCAFVPSSLFSENEGYFVVFQSAATGECIRPSSV